jgi:hypothetical protein
MPPRYSFSGVCASGKASTKTGRCYETRHVFSGVCKSGKAARRSGKCYMPKGRSSSAKRRNYKRKRSSSRGRKPCPRGSRRNGKTGRCRKSKSKSRR